MATLPHIKSGINAVTSRTAHNQSKTKEQREAEADAAGLRGTFRDQYVNTSRSVTYRNTFWDKVASAFGGKLGSEKYREALDLEDQTLINELINAQREQDWNAEGAQAERLREAGINPDLNGSSGDVSPSEASQIDDETFGSGLSEALGSIQTGAGQALSQAAQVFMNGATSILGLVRGGFDIAGLVQGQDLASLSSLFDFGQKTIDYLYNPTDPKIFSDPYFDKYKDSDGNIQLAAIDWDRYYREKFGIRSRSIRRKLVNMSSPVNSPMYLANKVGAAAKSSENQKSLMESEEYISSRVPEMRDLGMYDETGAAMIMQLQGSDTYQQFVRNAAELQLASSRAEIAQQKQLADYYEKLNKTPYSQRKALKDSFLQEYEAEAARARMTAAQQVNLNIQDLVKRSENGDWMATLMLQSVISGSFQSYGLGNPMELPMWTADKITGMANKLVDIITQGATKVLDPRTAASEKAIGTTMGKRAGMLMK